MGFFLDNAWLIPLLPFLAAALIALIGLRTPEKGGWIAVALVGLAGALCLGAFYDGLFDGSAVTFEAPAVSEFNWWSSGDLQMNFGLYLDPLTVFMLFTVGILVTLIALYSTGYMHAEGTARRRYYAELTLFITGMLGLVVSSNYLMLFVFWEIMGLCSYLLIGYWYSKPSAASAAKKAFLTTRVGDAFFLVGLGILFIQFKTLDFDNLFAAVADGIPDGVDRGALLLANSCIFIGAVGKSAQFPLHTWLPDAMEGPTTVSALIHAATMVKAGVYLVARSYPLFTLTPELLVAVAVIGGFTALFAASLALTNWDLKRVLAYSTLSQLGYMFLGLGVAGALVTSPDARTKAILLTGVGVAVFHLFSHAFFKAGLFLSAGSVGHAMHHSPNPYDMRAMGGLRKHMPITAFAMLMGTISISGIPIFSGFFSKDAILHAVYEAAHLSGGTIGLVYWALFGMAVLTAAMTAYYMFRLYFLTFEGEHRGPEFLARLPGWTPPAKSVGTPTTAAGVGAHEGHDAHGHHHAHAGPAAAPADHAHSHDDHDHHAHHEGIHESPWSMTVPLAILGTMAIVGGLVAFAFAGGEFTHFIRASDETARAVGAAVEEAAHGGLVDAITHPFAAVTTYVSIAAALVGIGLAWSLWGPGKAESRITGDDVHGIQKVWQKRYYVDQAYDTVFGKWILRQADSQDRFDADVIDGAVNGVARANEGASDRLRRWTTGNVQDYALTMLFGFVLIAVAVIYAPRVVDLWEMLAQRLNLGLLGGN